MRSRLVSLLVRLEGWRLWLLFSFAALVAVEFIVSVMDLLLMGRITTDYLVTGLVATAVAAPLSLYLLSYLLQELSRHRHEALLRTADSAESRLSAALNASDEGILMVAGDGKVLAGSKRFFELWRVSPELAAASKDELLLAHVLDQLVSPEQFLGEVRRLYGTDEEASDTLHFKDGRVFARYTRALLLGGERERIWCFRDITAQARAEVTLREQEELYRAIVSQAADGIELVDAETLRFVEVNDAACRMLGYRREELIQQPLLTIQAEVTEADQRKAVARIRQAGRATFQSRHRCKDGRVLDVHISVGAIRLQGRDLLVAIWRDITERILAERAMQQLNADLDATLRAIPDLLFEITDKGEYKRVWARNPELLAAQEEQLLGHTVSEVLPTDEANTCMSALRQAGERGYSHGKVIRLSLPDGDHWFELSVALKAGIDLSGKRFIVLSRDVTERMRSEEDLRTSERKLLAILENVDVCIYLKDTSGRYLFANRAVRELWRAGMDEIVGCGDEKFFDETTVANIRMNDRRVLEGGETVGTDEVTSVPARGVSAVFQTTKLPLRRDDGSIYALCGISTDVTGRKQIEDALRASEAKYRELVSNANAIILRMGLDGTVTFFNEFAERFFGYPAAEILGQHVVGTIVPPREAETGRDLAEMMSAILADPNRFTENENENITRDGRRVFVRWANRVMLDSQSRPTGVLAIGQDITERKRIEAELDRHRLHLEELVEQRTTELLATEARASRILDSTADGMYGVDAASRVVFINAACVRMFGYTAGQAIGRHAHALFHHSRPDGSPYPAEECAARQAWMAGKELRVDDETYWHADGHAVPVALATHPIFENGEVAGAVVSVVDASDQRAAAAARERALAAAESLARARSEFLANMSHEIRTPMNGVLGFAAIGLRNYQNGDKARNAFEKILASGNRLLGVVNEVLDFSKIEAGKLRIEAIEMSPAEVIDRSMELVADLARAKGLELRRELAADFPAKCIGDPMRVGQVLLNLLSNAVKFTGSGRIVVSASRHDAELVVRVSDTGIGISPEQIDRIFDPFHQVDGSSTRNFGGTGLGLAISKRILELMKGAISVKSRPGAGSCFEVRIPYVANDTTAATTTVDAAAEMAGRPLAGISVLVAEDDEVNQMVLKVNLVEDGARVVLAGTGRQAVERVFRDGAGTYDIVLMDIQMPDMDGYEATQRILALAPGLQIIGQTAHAFEEDRERCLAAGMAGYIAKPIDPRALVRLVLQLVAKKRGG